MACPTLVLTIMSTPDPRRRRARVPTNKAWEAFVTWCLSVGPNPAPQNNPVTSPSLSLKPAQRHSQSELAKQTNTLGLAPYPAKIS